jgi:hypothetical protein
METTGRRGNQNRGLQGLFGGAMLLQKPLYHRDIEFLLYPPPWHQNVCNAWHKFPMVQYLRRQEIGFLARGGNRFAPS